MIFFPEAPALTAKNFDYLCSVKYFVSYSISKMHISIQFLSASTLTILSGPVFSTSVPTYLFPSRTPTGGILLKYDMRLAENEDLVF